jgi:hypothetical protein
MNWYRAGLPSMALNGRLTSATSKRTLSMRKFSAVLNVTGRKMQPRSVTVTGPTPDNGRDSWSLPIGIYNFLKAARLMRLRAAPPSIKTWYSLMLEMVGETSRGRSQTQLGFPPTCGAVSLLAPEPLPQPPGAGS